MKPKPSRNSHKSSLRTALVRASFLIRIQLDLTAVLLMEYKDSLLLIFQQQQNKERNNVD
jgi:hypothetical protein